MSIRRPDGWVSVRMIKRPTVSQPRLRDGSRTLSVGMTIRVTFHPG